MAVSEDKDGAATELAARAAWLSFVGGMTQDQIAVELGISRQRVQRLVARASADGFVRVRIDHPVATCLSLERDLKARYGLSSVRIAPGVGDNTDPLFGLAPFAAPILERIFADPAALVIALGTGRTLRMVVEHMQQTDGSRHKLVSLIGNVAPDGSASFYEVIMRLAEKTAAPHYPMAIPVVARSTEELQLYRSLPHVRASRDLAMRADLAVVGIGQMDETAPLLVDGFITRDDLAELRAAGAVGEIVGHIFDAHGRYLDHPLNNRLVGVEVPVNGMPVHCIAAGGSKRQALKAALTGGLLTSLVTDEATAQALL